MVEFLPGLPVSRETEDKLRLLQAKLEKWNRTINLVAKTTVSDAWDRHIRDSAQIFSADFHHWVDLGSGGGFPGLVIAVLAEEFVPEGRVTLVEADQRKATFLRETARALSVPVTVQAKRIETLDPQGADVVSARALAPLDRLLEFATPHLRPGGLCCFPKGAGWREEVAAARKLWRFDLDVVQSVTQAEAVVLKVRAVEHV